MAKIISLSAIILGCILLVRADPPVNSYSISGENNGFEYNSNIINSAYMAGKEGHRETTDFYGGGSSGHSLTGSRSQGNLEESLRSSSYSGFSPSSHNPGFSSYSTSRETLPSSSYFANNAQSNFDSYTSSSSSNSADSGFDSAYTQASDQVGSDFSQFSSTKHKNPYMRFSDNLSGATSTGSYPELSTEGSTYRGEYPEDSFRSSTSHGAGFMDSTDQTYNRDTSNVFSGNDYSYGKHKEPAYSMGGGNKFMNDAYSLHPERYVRGNHGNMGRDYASSMILSNSGSSPFSGVRGASGIYSSGKFSKYNKYPADYPAVGLNYLSKEQDLDYLLSNYGKGSGKLAAIKEGRPSSYSSPYLAAPSYLSKIVGGYKSKPSFVSSYPSTSPVGYSSMSGLHSSFSGNSYADGPLLRRYRSSSYVPGHAGTYSGYY